MLKPLGRQAKEMVVSVMEYFEAELAHGGSLITAFEMCERGINAIFEMLRNILHEGKLEKRIQYMIEVMYQIRKDGFKDHAAVIQELDLVNEEDQFTHLITLDGVKQANTEDILNVFKFDEKYEENETKYKMLSKEILGSDEESGSEDSGDEDEEDEEVDEEGGDKSQIIDNTETNLTILRRTIYLTIQSSLDYEECAHKLLKMELKPGQEVEMCHMFLDCCAEQRTYEKFYGLLAQRFCQINKIYIEPFQQIFRNTFSTAHRLDTNRIRNVSKFCAHLLFTDAISWEVLEIIKLNEEESNSSSRVFVKILFQELAEYMGLAKLNARLKDQTLQAHFAGLFPRDNPKNTRFAINFFTSIGLGFLTDELREHLNAAHKMAQLSIVVPESSSSSDSDSSSSSNTSSDNSSDSDSELRNSKRKKNKNRKSLKSGVENRGIEGNIGKGRKYENSISAERKKKHDYDTDKYGYERIRDKHSNRTEQEEFRQIDRSDKKHYWDNQLREDDRCYRKDQVQHYKGHEIPGRHRKDELKQHLSDRRRSSSRSTVHKERYHRR